MADQRRSLQENFVCERPKGVYAFFDFVRSARSHTWEPTVPIPLPPSEPTVPIPPPSLGTYGSHAPPSLGTYACYGLCLYRLALNPPSLGNCSF